MLDDMDRAPDRFEDGNSGAYKAQNGIRKDVIDYFPNHHNSSHLHCESTPINLKSIIHRT